MKALVIDDDRGWRDVLCQELESANIEVEPLSSWSLALAKLKDSSVYNLVILDLFEAEEPHPSGLRFLRQMRNSGIHLPVIVVTGKMRHQNTSILRELLHEYRIFDYFEKTHFSGDEFVKSVKTVRAESDPALANVLRVCERFHLLARALETRHNGRDTLRITDEYDVQDLLGGVLKIFFDDIRPEEPAPSFAGRTSRVDFLIKEHKIAIEVKKTRKGLADAQVGEQLLLDARKYTANPEFKTVVCLVYDPDREILNPTAIEKAVAGLSSAQIKIIPVIVQA